MANATVTVTLLPSELDTIKEALTLTMQITFNVIGNADLGSAEKTKARVRYDRADNLLKLLSR